MERGTSDAWLRSGGQRTAPRSGRDMLQERDSGWGAGQAMELAAEQRNQSNEMIIEASRQATIKSEARSPKAESRSVSGFGMVLSQRPSPPTQGSSARSAMFIATTTPDAQPSSVGAAWMGQGGSKVRPVEGRSCSAALKSEDRRPKPERRPKSEFREWPNSIGCCSDGVAINSDLGFGLARADFRAALWGA